MPTMSTGGAVFFRLGISRCTALHLIALLGAIGWSGSVTAQDQVLYSYPADFTDQSVPAHAEFGRGIWRIRLSAKHAQRSGYSGGCSGLQPLAGDELSLYGVSSVLRRRAS